MIVPVILCGGSGTRLWPLSRERLPKQLIALVTKNTLLQDTVLRVRKLGEAAAAPLVMCNEALRLPVEEQLAEIGAKPSAIVLEPAGRNTAPAAAVAALLVKRVTGSSDDPLLLVLPADHLMLREEAFVEAVERAQRAASAGRLVTFGIVPDRPETGYGYILRGTDRGDWHDVEAFVEKPDAATAKRYVESGRYLWNSGMFMFSAGTYLDELRRHAPQMAERCERVAKECAVEGGLARLGAAFLDSPSDSIDYAVMERTGKAVVVPLDAGWSDLGSWQTLLELLEKDTLGNVVRGDVLARDCRNSYIGSTGRLVVALGLENLVVVETPDALLVMAQSHAQDMKKLVETLKDSGRAEVREHRPPAGRDSSSGG